MGRLARFKLLSSNERRLLVSAAVLLGITRLGLSLLSFQRLRTFLHKMAAPTNPGVSHNPPDQIIWAIETAVRHVPWSNTCLTRALATQVLLGRHGQAAHLRIGVAKSDQGDLQAHAWLENDGRVLIGHVGDLQRYTPFSGL